MENEELETVDSLNDEQEDITSENDEVVEVEEEAQEEEYTEREKQLYERLKKAEKELKDKKETKVVSKEKTTEPKLSTFDMLALQKANIETEEDLEEVTRWADYNKISVAEALKSNILKTVLTEKSEQRKSAMAVNTGTGRRAAGGAVSDERLLSDAEKGILPDSTEDIQRLTMLRMKNR